MSHYHAFLTPSALLLAASLGMAQATWTNRTTAATPGLGMDFASAFDEARGHLVVFGGLGGASGTGGANDLQYEWDGASWSQRTLSPRPGPRAKHDMAFDTARGVIVLSGGLAANRLPDTWEYDGTAWTLRDIAGPNEDFFNHRMVYDIARGVVVRFGGGGSGGLHGETYTWNGTTWTLRASGGPPPREQHAMAYDRQRQRVVLFGGWGNSGLLGDTWEWNGAAWQQMFPALVPAARREAGLSYTGSSRKLVLFGGYGTSTVRNDSFTWNGTNWTPLATQGTPPAMAYFELDLDTVRDRVVLVRGQEFSTSYIGHWQLNVPVTALATFTTFGAGCASSAGMPQIAAAPGSLPYLGLPFEVRMTGIPGSIFNPVFLLTGFSRTIWNGNALPLDLASLGMPGCSAWIAADATELLSNVAGTAAKVWTIPLAPALLGVEFHMQGAVLDPLVNDAGFALSNAGTVHIGQL